MTREHKLALLIGFALVMVVGIVVSDHFSGARSSQLGEVLGQEPPIEPEPEIFLASARLGGQLPADAPQSTSGGSTPNTGAVDRVAAAVQNGAAEVGQFVLEMGANLQRAEPAAVLEAPERALPSVSEFPQATAMVPAAESGFGASPATEPPRQQPVRQPDPLVRKLAEQQVAYPIHRVEPGDNLTKIARRYYGDGSLARKLQEFNQKRIAPDGTILVGASLFIPPKEVLLGGSPGAMPAIAGTPERTPARAEAGPSESRKSETRSADARTRTYTVKKGDTLASISQKQLGTTKRWREILSMNQSTIEDPDVLIVGTVLKIPAK